jgi:hypothetical protein
MAMNSDNACVSNPCLLSQVLMSMQKEFRFGTVNVSDERLKANVDIVRPIVNAELHRPAIVSPTN